MEVRTPVSRIRLLPSFDVQLLERDLAMLSPKDYVIHFNKRDYEGDWSVLPLRSIGGLSTHIYPDPTGSGKYEDTEFLGRCAYFKEIVDRFRPSVQSARLLRLGVGAKILEHTDLRLGIEDGEVRIHIPIQTRPEVEFYCNHESVRMLPGECWYLNFNMPHSAVNNSEADRIHLVLDCLVDEHLKSFFPSTEFEEALRSGVPNQGRI